MPFWKRSSKKSALPAAPRDDDGLAAMRAKIIGEVSAPFEAELSRLRDVITALEAENSRLEAENLSLLSKAGLVSLPKAAGTKPKAKDEPMSEVETKITKQASQEDIDNACTFWFLDVAQFKAWGETTLPFFQDIRRRHPQMLVQKRVTFIEAMQGSLVTDFCTVSHRWIQADVPDPDGAQYRAVVTHLAKKPSLKYLWYDAWCMPQGEKTAEEAADFKRMLSQVNLLYLGTSVLLLVDLSYLSRFWTQFEAWAAMQQATTGGLRRAEGSERRESFQTIYNGSEAAVKMLEAQWATPTPKQAHGILSAPDVVVTNQSDKTQQLKKLLHLQALVLKLNSGSDSTKLVFNIERAVGPKPTDRTWKDEWVDGWMERNKLYGENFGRDVFESGGVASIDAKIGHFTDAIRWKTNDGWDYDLAAAYTCLLWGLPAPLAKSVQDKDSRYAASIHVINETLVTLAKKQHPNGRLPPINYKHLNGLYALSTDDKAFEALKAPGVGVGTGFSTYGITAGYRAEKPYFEDPAGFMMGDHVGGKVTYKLQDSPLVCFLQAKPDDDGYYHAAVTVGGDYHLPPMSTLTLEKIEEAGTYKINDIKMKQRLYTCSCSWQAR